MIDAITSSPDEPTQRVSDAIESKWREIVSEFQRPSLIRSTWQIVNSVGVYLFIWYLMYLSLGVSYWLTIPLAIAAGGFLVRVFIIFHDCTHGSFFRSRKANDILGFITGVLTFTPYHQWRWEHTIHHAHAGDLDERGMGDVWTMTVQEYLAASRWTKFRYQLARNPVVLFVLAPTFLFLVLQRFPLARASKQIRRFLHCTNLCVIAQIAVLIWIFGLQAYLGIQFIVLLVAATSGIWLFYVQHQFEGVSWERGENWNFTEAALKGSSFYRLPRILQWFPAISGSITFTTSARGFPTTILKAATRLIRSFSPSNQSASYRASSRLRFDSGTRKAASLSGSVTCIPKEGILGAIAMLPRPSLTTVFAEAH